VGKGTGLIDGRQRGALYFSPHCLVQQFGVDPHFMLFFQENHLKVIDK
jgi:hypothetical protein